MRKFHIEASFGLTSTIEPSGAQIEGSYDVEDYEDNSYFGSEDVSVSGGEVSFTVEADDEYDAERKAEEIVQDGSEIEDETGLTWMVCDVSISVEEVEIEMTLDRAIELLTALFDRLTSGSEVTDEEREAFKFLLTFIATQNKPQGFWEEHEAERAKLADES